jgi:hypothetical protein
LTTATVETLTAEVRALVVGSRQITLSVAKQLDVVPLAQLRLFGRVNLSKDENFVIGADADGTLALAKYDIRRIGHHRSFLDEEDLEGAKIVVCVREPMSYDKTFILAYDGMTFEIVENATERCGIESHRWPNDKERCGGWNPNGLGDLISAMLRDQKAEHDAWDAQQRAAAQSPLIILAGLK